MTYFSRFAGIVFAHYDDIETKKEAKKKKIIKQIEKFINCNLVRVQFPIGLFYFYF